MAIDKRIDYRLGGDTMKKQGRMDQMGGKPGLTAAQIRAVDPISYGGTLTGPAFVGGGNQNNQNDDTPFVPPTKKKKTVDDVVNTGGPKPNPLKTLLNFLNPLSYLEMLNNPETRKRLTGYETQAEYEQARQNRINLNRIKTIENTLARKYSDGDYSQTDLDERLAVLKSQMGITPNTAADLRPDLDFSNQSELAFEGIGSLDKGNQDFNYMFDVDKTADLINATKTRDFDYLGPNFNEGLLMDYQELDESGIGSLPEFGGTVLQNEFPSTREPSFIEVQDTPQSRDEFFLNAIADAKPVIDNRTLLEKLLSPRLGVDEALDKEELKRKREQELLEELMRT